MNRHYKKKTGVKKLVYVAYKDYAPWSNCTLIYGVFTKLKDAMEWVKRDANFREDLDYEIYREVDYNGYSIYEKKHKNKVQSVPLGNRIGERYEIYMNTTGKIDEGPKIRYVVYQTYVDIMAV